MELHGNIASDIELKETTTGVPFVNILIAQDVRKRDADGEWRDAPSLFFRAQLWRRAAENAAASLTKGMPVVAVGEWAADEWSAENGDKRRSQWVNVSHIGPDLARCTATVKWEPKGKAAGKAVAAPEPADDSDPFEQD